MNWGLAGLLILTVVWPNPGYAQELPNLTLDHQIDAYCHGIVLQAAKQSSEANPQFVGLDDNHRFQRCVSQWSQQTQKDRQSLMAIWRSIPAKVRKACLNWQFNPRFGQYALAPDETRIFVYSYLLECLNARGEFLDSKFFQFGQKFDTH